MNELIKITNHGDKQTTSARDLWEFLGNENLGYYDLLILASKLRFNNDPKSIDTALAILEVAKLIEPPESENEYLRDAVWETIIHAKHAFLQKEFDLHEKFKKEISKLIPSAKVIKKKNIKDNYPDVWVDVNGAIRPVEIKLRKFDNRALRQLMRYIKVYKVDLGYAVARELACKLPSCVSFIPLSLKTNN